MFNRPKTMVFILYGTTVIIFLAYLIGCVLMPRMHVDWVNSIANSDKDSQKYLNYYLSSQWKTNEEISGQSTQDHAHKSFCVIAGISTIIFSIAALGYSTLLRFHSSHKRERLTNRLSIQEYIFTPEILEDRKRDKGKSFWSRPTTIRDEIIVALSFLLIPQIIRFLYRSMRRYK